MKTTLKDAEQLTTWIWGTVEKNEKDPDLQLDPAQLAAKAGITLDKDLLIPELAQHLSKRIQELVATGKAGRSQPGFDQQWIKAMAVGTILCARPYKPNFIAWSNQPGRPRYPEWDIDLIAALLFQSIESKGSDSPSIAVILWGQADALRQFPRNSKLTPSMVIDFSERLY